MDEKRIIELENRLSNMERILSNHNHSGADGSNKKFNDMDFKPGSQITIGNSAMTEYSDNVGLTNERDIYIIAAGKDTSAAVSTKSGNSQISMEHQPGSTGTTNQTFYYGYRAPLYTSLVGSITSGGSTLTDLTFGWVVNSLAGAWVDVYDGTTLYSHLISSNTATEITISDTFAFTDSTLSYTIFVPVYLGSADYPWRRVYTATDIRFGIGGSSGTKVCFIKHGTGTPEGAVTSQIGSLFLRLDGGAGTTLYVKESGTGNTGWVGK